MPMKPSRPISAIASRGKRASRSHSAAWGANFSRANARAVSLTIVCASLSNMSLLSLPGNLGAVVIEEPAIVGGLEPGDHRAHAGNAGRGVEGSAGATHVGAHPARMKHHASDAASHELEGEHAHAGVERRLAHAVGMPPRTRARDRAQLARDEDHQPHLALRHVVGEGGSDAERCYRVDAQDLEPLLVAR